MIGFKRHLEKYGEKYADLDSASRSDAQQLLACVTSFEVIFVFLTVYQFLSHLAGITIKLQKEAIDIFEAHEIITEISKIYTRERENINCSFTMIYAQSLRMAENRVLAKAC